MKEIPLAAVPGQTLTLTEGTARYQITLKEARGVMVCSIVANGVPIVTGSRALAGEMLIPYRYREPGGNFIFETVGGELPAWREFGSSQRLYFLTAEELGVIRGDD